MWKIQFKQYEWDHEWDHKSFSDAILWNVRHSSSFSIFSLFLYFAWFLWFLCFGCVIPLFHQVTSSSCFLCCLPIRCYVWLLLCKWLQISGSHPNEVLAGGASITVVTNTISKNAPGNRSNPAGSIVLVKIQGGSANTVGKNLTEDFTDWNIIWPELVKTNLAELFAVMIGKKGLLLLICKLDWLKCQIYDIEESSGIGGSSGLVGKIKSRKGIVNTVYIPH